MSGFCGLENDVFISYAHADNTLGWVSAFERQLNARLNELRRNAGFTVWRDPRLGGTYILTDEITRRLKSCGVLISVLSPNGLESDWCQSERQTFEVAAGGNGGVRIVHKARTVRITKSPCEYNRDRDLFGTAGHDFYRRNASTNRFEEFHPTSREFEDLVLEIAQEVYELLTELKQKNGAGAQIEQTTVTHEQSSPLTPKRQNASARPKKHSAAIWAAAVMGVAGMIAAAIPFIASKPVQPNPQPPSKSVDGPAGTKPDGKQTDTAIKQAPSPKKTGVRKVGDADPARMATAALTTTATQNQNAAHEPEVQPPVSAPKLSQDPLTAQQWLLQKLDANSTNTAMLHSWYDQIHSDLGVTAGSKSDQQLLKELKDTVNANSEADNEKLKNSLK